MSRRALARRLAAAEATIEATIEAERREAEPKLNLRALTDEELEVMVRWFDEIDTVGGGLQAVWDRLSDAERERLELIVAKVFPDEGST